MTLSGNIVDLFFGPKYSLELGIHVPRRSIDIHKVVRKSYEILQSGSAIFPIPALHSAQIRFGIWVLQ